MKLYISRALKYTGRMVVIFAILITVLWATDTLDTGGLDLYQALFMSWRGLVLIGVVVIFAIMYPNISFTTVAVQGDARSDRRHIIEAFEAYSYRLVREKDGKMIFHSRSLIRRILRQFDDGVAVWQNDGNIEMEGLKKIVSRVILRLDVYINQHENE